MFSECTRGEMDIIPVFGTVVGGSNPSGCTRKKTALAVFLYSIICNLLEGFVEAYLVWCGYRESNPNLVLGKDVFYH
jgi:hypothetical protein